MAKKRKTVRQQHVRNKSKVVLLLIDVINRMDFDGAEKLIPHALRMARSIVRLKNRAKELGIPTVYVNDNFGIWRSDFRSIVDSCLEDDAPGKEIVKLLHPTKDDYFVLKPMHSAFYQTTLDLLLHYFGTEILILTGVQAHICILFSANDAYMREYQLAIPTDCVASEDPSLKKQAMNLMKTVLKADIKGSSRLKLKKFL